MAARGCPCGLSAICHLGRYQDCKTAAGYGRLRAPPSRRLQMHQALFRVTMDGHVRDLDGAAPSVLPRTQSHCTPGSSADTDRRNPVQIPAAHVLCVSSKTPLLKTKPIFVVEGVRNALLETVELSQDEHAQQRAEATCQTVGAGAAIKLSLHGFEVKTISCFWANRGREADGLAWAAPSPATANVRITEVTPATALIIPYALKNYHLTICTNPSAPPTNGFPADHSSAFRIRGPNTAAAHSFVVTLPISESSAWSLWPPVSRHTQHAMLASFCDDLGVGQAMRVAETPAQEGYHILAVCAKPMALGMVPFSTRVLRVHGFIMSNIADRNENLLFLAPVCLIRHYQSPPPALSIHDHTAHYGSAILSFITMFDADAIEREAQLRSELEDAQHSNEILAHRLSSAAKDIARLEASLAAREEDLETLNLRHETMKLVHSQRVRDFKEKHRESLQASEDLRNGIRSWFHDLSSSIKEVFDSVDAKATECLNAERELREIVENFMTRSQAEDNDVSADPTGTQRATDEPEVHVPPSPRSSIGHLVFSSNDLGAATSECAAEDSISILGFPTTSPMIDTPRLLLQSHDVSTSDGRTPTEPSPLPDNILGISIHRASSIVQPFWAVDPETGLSGASGSSTTSPPPPARQVANRDLSAIEGLSPSAPSHSLVVDARLHHSSGPSQSSLKIHPAQRNTTSLHPPLPSQWHSVGGNLVQGYLIPHGRDLWHFTHNAHASGRRQPPANWRLADAFLLTTAPRPLRPHRPHHCPRPPPRPPRKTFAPTSTSALRASSASTLPISARVVPPSSSPHVVRLYTTHLQIPLLHVALLVTHLRCVAHLGLVAHLLPLASAHAWIWQRRLLAHRGTSGARRSDFDPYSRSFSQSSSLPMAALTGSRSRWPAVDFQYAWQNTRPLVKDEREKSLGAALGKDLACACTQDFYISVGPMALVEDGKEELKDCPIHKDGRHPTQTATSSRGDKLPCDDPRCYAAPGPQGRGARDGGGIRSGTDTFCAIAPRDAGRLLSGAYAYRLVVAGQEGVEAVMKTILVEFKPSLAARTEPFLRYPFNTRSFFTSGGPKGIRDRLHHLRGYVQSMRRC
ncbi:uncharacterized protein BXZ73DRAFT_82647 [Epithele typhae]|uniref:uncharacterized protein n=1 Tax=Epithele typhae TaxID=378194 RepID=UPI002007E5CA|nr:uncharacterized protein BXZ73DRAFT_82647 [Epithele typhae]KAH9911727.1 hypothetical protein BXZ73DRAFT_82647 [Epithele typhae]